MSLYAYFVLQCLSVGLLQGYPLTHTTYVKVNKYSMIKNDTKNKQRYPLNPHTVKAAAAMQQSWNVLPFR